MTLRKKTIAVTGLIFLALILVLFEFFSTSLLAHIDTLEQEACRKDADRVLEAIGHDLNTLAISALDWAAWDDTYAFVEDRDPAYLTSNFTSATMEHLQLNVLAIIDREAQVITGLGYDTVEQEPVPGLLTALQGHLAPGSLLLQHTPGARGSKGLVLLDGVPMLIAARPVLTSQGEGPPRGTLIMGRSLDDLKLRQIAGITHSTLTIQPWNSPTLPADFARARSTLSPADPVDVRPLDERVIAGYAMLTDIMGRPALLLRIQEPRTIHIHGLAFTRYLLFGLLGLLLVFGLANLIVIERLVLARVSRLNHHVDSIGQHRDLSARVPMTGADELGSLAEAINEMLAALDRAYEEQREGERRHRAVVEQCVEGIFLADAVTMRVLEANQAFCDLLGHDAPAMERLTLYDIVADDRYTIDHSIAAWCAGGSAEPTEQRYRKREGELVDVEVTATPIEYGGRDVLCLVVRDITERKRVEEERLQLEQQMRHSQKLESLGVLAGGIAHDFNNLLMGILGNAGLALMKLPERESAAEHLEQIETTAQRAADLCNQMLAYSGKGRFVVRPVDLSKLVEEMAHLLEVSISKKVMLRYDFADDLPLIEVDTTQLRQVVMNLITNASDAMGDNNGEIIVRTGVRHVDQAYLRETYVAEDLAEGEYVFLEVRDTGCGMSPATLQRIFDPFFTTKFTGRGLGLAAVLGIIRGHGGTIRVSSAVGRGTCFTVLLPKPSEAAVARPEDAVGPQSVFEWRPKGTVLIVDDEASVRQVASNTCQTVGLEVLTAADGREGVELFEQHADHLSAVLLDLTMPEMNGAEALGEMARIRLDVPVVLSSGYNEQDVSQRFAGTALAGFIQKPYRPADLLAKLREVMEPDSQPVGDVAAVTPASRPSDPTAPG